MDHFILKLLLPFVKWFAGNSVNYSKLKIIVQTKLLMDRRRKPLSWKANDSTKFKNPLWGTLLLNMLLSILIALPAFLINNILLVGLILNGYVLFMIMMTLITDFSTVLLDTADNQILLPRPVDAKTMFVARLLHVSVYLLQFTLSLSLLPLMAIFINFGVITGVTGFLMVLLTSATAVFFTYLLYLLLFSFFKEQHIKNLVTYFQIFMTILLLGSYQILPRLITFENLSKQFNLPTAAYFLPPVWMSMFMEAVTLPNFSRLHLVMMACAIIVPVFTLWLMTKYLAPQFNKKIAAMGMAAIRTQTDSKKMGSKKSISEQLSTLFCKDSLQAAGFEKVWKITNRDKNFKLQFYPGLGYIFILLLVIIFKKDQAPTEIYANLKEGSSYLIFIYLPLWMLYSSLYIIPFHQNYEAAWIYASLPIKKPGQIILGGLKALFIKFFIPFYILFFGIALFIWGAVIIDDFIYGLLNTGFVFLLLNFISDFYLPFSLKPDVKRQAGKFIKIIFQSLAIGILIVLHYFVLKINYLTFALMPVFIMGILFLIKKLKNISWQKINY